MDRAYGQNKRFMIVTDIVIMFGTRLDGRWKIRWLNIATEDARRQQKVSTAIKKASGNGYMRRVSSDGL